MKLTFNKIYFIASVLLFLVEVLIATFLKSGFIRHTFGDFLVVILIYCFIKSFFTINSHSVAIITLVIAYVVEFIQLTPFLEHFELEDEKWANLLFGNSFSTQDLVAYTLGVMVVFTIDNYFVTKSNA